MDRKDFRSDANIVRQQERSKGWKNEPTGEVEKLLSNEIKMGSSLSSSITKKGTSSSSSSAALSSSSSTAVDNEKHQYGLKINKRSLSKSDEVLTNKKNKKAKKSINNINNRDIVSEILDNNKKNFKVINQFYTPKTKETAISFELLLSLIQKIMGDISQDILQSAAEEIITIIRNFELTITTKK